MFVQVSVIIPTRNRPTCLKVTIEGVTKQNFKNIELKVIDNGSSKENAVIYKLLVNDLYKRISNYIYLTEHNRLGSGPSYARNIGVNFSKDTIIAFCDDIYYWFYPDHIKQSVNSFSNDHSVDMFYANQETHVNDVASKFTGDASMTLLSDAIIPSLNTAAYYWGKLYLVYNLTFKWCIYALCGIKYITTLKNIQLCEIVKIVSRNKFLVRMSLKKFEETTFGIS